MSEQTIQSHLHSIGISDIANSMFLKEGTTVEAIVKEVLSDNKYLLSVKGLLLEIAMPLLVEQGNKIPIKVIRLSNDKIILNVLSQDNKGQKIEGLEPIIRITEDNISTILEKLDEPVTNLNKKIVAELIRQNVPITPQAVETISSLVGKLESTQDEKTSASIFLISRGIQPTIELVNKLTNYSLELSNAKTPTKTAIIKSASEFIKSIAVGLNNKEAQTYNLKDLLPPNVKEAIKAVLESSPRLRTIDNALEFIIQKENMAQTGKADLNIANKISSLLIKELMTIKQKSTDSIEISTLKNKVETLNKETLLLLKSKILEIERKEIISNPILSQARTEKGSVFEIIDRITLNNIINQSSTIKQDGIYITQIIAEVDGRTTFIPVKIFHNKQGKGKKYSKPLTAFVLEIDMSKVGKVQVVANILSKNIDIKFKVRNKSIKQLFERHEPELKTSLKDMGYEVVINTELLGEKNRENTILHIPDDNYKPYISVDIKV